jgi:hypothetical protein
MVPGPHVSHVRPSSPSLLVISLAFMALFAAALVGMIL